MKKYQIPRMVWPIRLKFWNGVQQKKLCTLRQIINVLQSIANFPRPRKLVSTSSTASSHTNFWNKFGPNFEGKKQTVASKEQCGKKTVTSKEQCQRTGSRGRRHTETRVRHGTGEGRGCCVNYVLILCNTTLRTLLHNTIMSTALFWICNRVRPDAAA